MTLWNYDIRLEDLPEECRQIAEVIGLAATLALVQARGGEPLYLPKPERLAIQARNRAIRAQFDGCNHHELARKFSLTVQWIREIVGRPRAKDCPTDIQSQLKLF